MYFSFIFLINIINHQYKVIQTDISLNYIRFNYYKIIEIKKIIIIIL